MSDSNRPPRLLTPSLIDRIARETEEWTTRVGATNGCMHLLSTNRARLLCQAVTTGYRATQLAHGLSIEESAGAKQALTTGEVVVVEETLGNRLVARVAAEVYGLRSCIYAPIRPPGASECEGVLVFSHRYPHAWSAEQIGAARQAGEAFATLLAERLARSSPEEPHTQTERRLRALLDVAPSLTAAIDRDFIVYESSNPRGEVPRVEPLRVSNVVHQLRVSPRRVEIERAIAAMHDGNLGRASFLLNMGSSSVQLDLAPIYSENGIEGVGMACLDITEALEAKRLLEDSQHTLALGQIAARVAHEFNNILQAVSVSADLLEIEQGVSDEHLVVMRQAVDRGAKLASELLSFSRVHPPSFRESVLATAVSSHWKLLQSAVGRDHDLVLIVRKSPATQLDTDRIQLAVLNLCINARDASAPGASIDVIVDEQQRAGRPFATVTVVDRGQGMSPEVLARATEPFFTTKPRGQGTGLGLAAVKSTVDAHQGWMSINSDVGKGTSITMAFPMKAQPALPRDKSVPPPRNAGAQANGRHVLVVEDEPLIGQFFEAALRREGHEVRRVMTVAEAVSMLQREPSWVDLVLLDMTLPDGSGRLVYEAITAVRPEVRFVLCSGFAEASDTEKMRAAGHPLLAKPISTQALLAAVRARLQDEPPGS